MGGGGPAWDSNYRLCIKKKIGAGGKKAPCLNFEKLYLKLRVEKKVQRRTSDLPH